jgi:AcrR family transcriptional regulator
MADATTKRRGEPATRGQRTREAVLATAVDVASTEGLEGLTIGRLALELGMSKSGLFAHFGSKEELQIATIHAAREIFLETVARPALAEPPGLPRLWGLVDGWVRYVEESVFRGGCFFAAASAEFDGRPGPVRDLVAATMREWLGGIERAIAEARDAGHLASDVDPARLAFELNAFGMATNWEYQLFSDAAAFERGRVAMAERVARFVTSKGASAVPALAPPKGRRR